MKELQELRNYILELKNMGVIKKTTEITLLHKLNALEKQFAISGVVNPLKDKEKEYLSYLLDVDMHHLQNTVKDTRMLRDYAERRKELKAKLKNL
jgi:hypothetical protein